MVANILLVVRPSTIISYRIYFWH